MYPVFQLYRRANGTSRMLISNIVAFSPDLDKLVDKQVSPHDRFHKLATCICGDFLPCNSLMRAMMLLHVSVNIRAPSYITGVM